MIVDGCTHDRPHFHGERRTYLRAGHSCRCDECREANRRYQAERRATNPDARTYDRTYMRARERALQTLSELHPSQFEELLAHELERSRAASA